MKDYLVHLTLAPDRELPRITPSHPEWLLQRAETMPEAAAKCLSRSGWKRDGQDLVAFVTAKSAPRHPSGVPVIVHRFDLKIQKGDVWCSST